MNTTITLREYLTKEKTFKIPNYQRGYIWGKECEGRKNAVEYLMDDLLKRYETMSDVFLQGVTVSEREDEIILIDGQQRTTFFYLLLKCLGYKGDFKIEYEVRKASHDFLQSFDLSNKDEEKYQDIYFFKKTYRIIEGKLNGMDKASFLDFVLDKVKFLYIDIPDEEQAKRIFSMMNGNKAVMQQEEIIKAEILRLASLSEDVSEDVAHEWELNVLRSRYAREWDKWLHWWNQEKVKRLFGCDNIMGLLISSYLLSNDKGKINVLTLESFREAFLSGGTPHEAKTAFDGLRRLQKRFEDAFNDPVVHNMIGAIMCIFNDDNIRKFIVHYFVDKMNDLSDLKDYYMLAFLGLTHDEIVNVSENEDVSKKSEIFWEKYEGTLKALEDDFLYIQNPEKAFQLLLRLNVDQDILQERPFNFDIIWDKHRSLEHIYPKSKVIHQDEDGNWYRGDGVEYKEDNVTEILRRDDIRSKEGNDSTTEHSIGNLVLLYKNENSSFSNNNFEEKKLMFFNPSRKELFKSRHLLSTICVFAEKGTWDGPAIAANKKATIEKFKEDYKELRKEYEK